MNSSEPQVVPPSHDLRDGKRSRWNTQPAWYDDKKFKRGCAFFIRHEAAITFSMHVSLLAGLSIERFLKILVMTNKSSTAKTAFSRYLMTFFHINKWMKGNIWDPNSDAHVSFEIVHSFHDKARETAHVEFPKEGEHVTQADLRTVQAGFFGAVLMYPELFGIRCSKNELDDYAFVWRVVGYKLGIEDEHNLCKDHLSDTKIGVFTIEQRILIPSLECPPSDFEHMAQAYVKGTNQATPFPLNSENSLLAFVYDGLKETFPRPLKFMDKLRYYFLKSVFFMVYHSDCFEKLFNYMFTNLIYGRYTKQAEEEFQKQKARLHQI